MNVVIVDDSATNLVILKQLAKKEASVSVETFVSPIQAREYLEHNDCPFIIVDCEMPEMNGIDFITTVRAMDRHASTPIVMVTNHAASEIRKKALEAGATEFLTKPVDAHEFRLRMRDMMLLTKPHTIG
jgi:DNA-binding response OmpR family regulator